MENQDFPEAPALRGLRSGKPHCLPHSFPALPAHRTAPSPGLPSALKAPVTRADTDSVKCTCLFWICMILHIIIPAFCPYSNSFPFVTVHACIHDRLLWATVHALRKQQRILPMLCIWGFMGSIIEDFPLKVHRISGGAASWRGF